MKNYLKKLNIPDISVNAIDHISIASFKKRVIAFCAIGLLCTMLVASVSANNGFTRDNQITSNISIIIEPTNQPTEPTNQPTDLLAAESTQIGDGQANRDISIVTRGNEFQDLRNGSEGANVEKIQQSLTDKEFYTGPINSKFGPLTEAAVIEFQKKNGLDGNGIVDQRVLAMICTPVIKTAAVKTAADVNIEGLKNGSEGAEVIKLQQKLKDKGFYDGPIIGKFGPLTETSVKAFQKKIGIETNGIVTTKVMDKLDAYKLPVTIVKTNKATAVVIKTVTTPVSVKPAANGVELLDWSLVKTIFKVGLTASVYDVRSGLTYKVKSFSNGNHADVEPITADDTAIMLKTYGGVWKWDPRPVWVTVNGRTIAGSINGMPHGGDTNPYNNMAGQICIHFRGSTTHNGNLAFAQDHQDAVTEAWNLAQK
jgi:peptidoglycan hydrolase-like protein with peptidoglycan-binding domain